MIYVIGYPETSGKAIVEEMGIYKDVMFIDEVWNTENEQFNGFREWYNRRKYRFGFKALRKIIGGGAK